jgi:uncharacterized protein YbcI
MCSQLIESCREQLCSLVAADVECDVVSMHADISAHTGERVFVFVVSEDVEARFSV